MSRKASVSECDSTTCSTTSELHSYFDFIEEFPDDLAKVISQIKEYGVRSSHLLRNIDLVTTQMCLHVDSKPILKGKLESLLAELQDVNVEKATLAARLEDFVKQKLETLNSVEMSEDSINKKKKKTSLSTTRSEPTGSSTPRLKRVSITKMKGGMKERRGRKPKRALFQKQETKAGAKKEEPVDLLMLAEVALKREHIPITLHVRNKKRRGRRGRRGKGKPVKQPPPPSKKHVEVENEDSETEDADDEVNGSRGKSEVDENEPLYCICNKVSFGQMIECDNEGCNIEWCHFDCVGLKRAPKGKWYCPKCRSKKSNMLKKDLFS